MYRSNAPLEPPVSPLHLSRGKDSTLSARIVRRLASFVRAAAIAVAVLAHGASALAGGPIVNGDFAVAVPSNGTGGGWTSSDIGAPDGWLGSLGNPAPCFYLNEVGGALDPTVTQELSGLTPGGCYILSGDYATLVRNATPPGVPSLRVKVNGVPIFMGMPTGVGQPPTTVIWKSFVVSFIAPASGAVTISLSAEVNGTDNDFMVDNICLTPCCNTENGQFGTFVPVNEDESPATGGDWTTANTSRGGWIATGGDPASYFHLNQVGEVGVDPSMSQIINGLTTGECYVLTGDYASIINNALPPNVDSLEIDVSGVGTIFAAKPTALGVWTGFAAAFTAPGAAITVTFRAEIGTTDNDFGLDNICLIPCCIGDIVENGHFDTEVSVSIDDSTLTDGGWTTANTSRGGRIPAGGDPGAYFYLNQVGEIGVDPSISQTIAGLTGNGCYVLTGDYTSIIHNDSPLDADSFAVDITGNPNVTANYSPTAIGLWTAFAVPFVAPAAGSVTVTFRAEIGATDNDIGIDNICLVPCGPPPPCVSIDTDPDEYATCPSGTAEFLVLASGNGPFDYVWQMEDASVPDVWDDLSDGVFVIDGNTCGSISGSREPTLIIAGACSAGHGRRFRAVVSNICGTATSGAAVLTIRPTCDYNDDGGADNTDITDLANDIASGTQSYPPCTADFNDDGGADNTDVTDLADAIASGTCP